MKPVLLVLAAVLACIPSAHARDKTGALDIVIVPNSGLPSCVLPGGTLEIVIRTASTTFTLERDAVSVPLKWSDRAVTTEGIRLTCIVPEGTAPGAWALRADSDLNRGAVFVLPEASQTYTLALLAFPRDTPPESAALGAAHEAGAALLVIMGETDIYERLVPMLDDAPLPVFICPPSGETQEFSRYFGPANTGFRYGSDGFLRFSAPEDPTLDEIDGGDAPLQHWQRVLRPCRWRIGLADRIGPDMGLRRQFVLFVDTPLDYCLVRNSSFATPGTAVHRVPWGSTVVGVPSDASDTPLRLVTVDLTGLSPLELQSEK